MHHFFMIFIRESREPAHKKLLCAFAKKAGWTNLTQTMTVFVTKEEESI